jgi:unsaturated rhamnogalacturonyl hydrolase
MILKGMIHLKILDDYIKHILEVSKPELPLWNIESIKQGKNPAWNYIDGCMMISLLALYEQTGDSKYFNFVHNFINYYVDETGNILGYNQDHQNLDDICESRVLFDLFEQTHDPRYAKAILFTYQHIEKQPRTKEGNFWHKKIYPHQVWLDGLFMAQPFYTRYETMYNHKKNYLDIITQFKNVRNIMFDEEKRLYFHGYDSTKSIFWAHPQTGLSKHFWLRAIGWFVVGLIDVISYMADDFLERNHILIPMLKECLDGLLLYKEPKSNMFYQVVDQGERLGNYLETSGSALISYAILKSVRLGVLPASYQSIGLSIFKGICERNLTEVNGKLQLGGICLVAGLGPNDNKRRDGSYDYYISEPIVENDAKGVGPLIMAYTEYKKINAI